MNSDKIRNLYFIIGGGGVISFLIVLIQDNINAAIWLVMQHNFQWQFSDFFRQIIYASDLQNIYFNTGDAPFPPLAYIFFNMLYKMNPTDALIELSSWKIVQDNQYNLLIYVIFMMMAVIFLVEIIKMIICYGEIYSMIFSLLVLLSAPFMSGAIERGNIAIIVCVLILWAMYLKDSDVIWKRELALILIAVSAGLKIYPAVFGVIYIKERRWKEAVRLLIYGITFFFFPFVWTGGIEGLKQYIKIIANFEGSVACRWTNIRCFLFAILNEFGYKQNRWLGIVVENVYLIVCMGTMFKTKERWKHILFPAGIMATYVSNSYRYTSIYMLIPFVFWLKQRRGDWSDYVYCILFSLIFTIPTYAYFINLEVDVCVFVPIYLTPLYNF